MKFLIFFAISLSSVNCFEILGILPFESKSHFAIGHGIMSSLADFFHNVTVVSPYPLKKPLEYYKDISIASGTSEAEYEGVSAPWFMNSEYLSIFPGLKFLYESGDETVNHVMTHPNFRELIDSGKKFKVCIIENCHFEALMGLAEVFDCILITYTTYPAVQMLDRMTGNISPMSFVPNSFLGLSEKMNFQERFLNVVSSLFEKAFYELYHLPNQRRLYEKYFPQASRAFDDVYKNSSIIFVNSHVSMTSPRPLLPNMIEIGGIHVRQANPLKKNFAKFMDLATEGVIIFSMGSIMRGTDWEDDQREAFVRAFGKLKEKVLWKYENETLPNKPENVKITSWLPQRDLLAHPNVKLFITHGGLLGTTEAVVQGVPILGIPTFGDQMMNVAMAVSDGYGLQLNHDEITEETISQNLNELLTNPKYKETAKLKSVQFKERPLTPKLSVIFWTRYAARNNGAFHLRAEAVNLNYFAFRSIDVYIVFLTVLVLIFYLMFKILIFLKNLLFKKKIIKEKIN